MDQLLNKIIEQTEVLTIPFWEHADFRITTIIAVLSLGASLAAFFEAKKAKNAANEAARFVKIQTVLTDLTEINQRIDQVSPEITYLDARAFLQETRRKIIRLTSPFSEDSAYSSSIGEILAILKDLNLQLKSVRPLSRDSPEAIPHEVYNATEELFAELSACLAGLLGKLDKRNIDDH